MSSNSTVSTTAAGRSKSAATKEKVYYGSTGLTAEDLLVQISKELNELNAYQSRGPSIAQFIWSSLLQVSAVGFAVASVVVSIYAWKTATIANNLTLMANRFALVAICQSGMNDASVNCGDVYQQAAGYLNQDINSLFNPSGTISTPTTTPLITATTTTSNYLTTTATSFITTALSTDLQSSITSTGDIGSPSPPGATSSLATVPPSSSPTTPPSSKGTTQSSHLPGIIAGGVLGGLSLLIALLTSSFFAWRGQRRG